MHYDGANWMAHSSGVTQSLNGVWGSAGNDVHAAGQTGTLLHYDGAWRQLDSGTVQHLASVRGSAADDVFAAGFQTLLHWDGVAWSPVRVPLIGFEALQVTPSAVLAAGESGTILRLYRASPALP